MKVLLGCALIGVSATVCGEIVTLDLLPDEYWWGGEVGSGFKMPLGKDSDYVGDMRRVHGLGGGNQAAPLLLSTKGRWVWCEDAFKYGVREGAMVVETDPGAAEIVVGRSGESLRTAFEHCSRTYFPPAGMPKRLFFEKPILNSWIELIRNQGEDAFLEFVDSFFRQGEDPGVVMIDCFWQRGNYGEWDFRKDTFRDPKGMIDKLHARGCRVMLWICPFLSMDSIPYRELAKTGGLITLDGTDPAPIKWWDGKSAMYDPTDPRGRAWFKGRLDWLMNTYGVDGFFFDAGDCEQFANSRPFVTCDPKASNADLTRATQMMAEEVPYQQLRAAWKQGGRPLMNTLRDKYPTWDEMKRCIKDMIAAGQLGYPFIVADLVGGGTSSNFEVEGGRNSGKFNAELFVRHLQIQALSPMVQFSGSPWRWLSKEKQAMVKKTLAVRRKFTPYIIRCAQDCGRTGLPMLRSLDFQFPGKGYELVLDQFMMGDDLLVAPVVDGGVRTRTAVIPEGAWRSDRAEIVVGPKTVVVETPLERLPYWEKVEEK